MGKLKLLSEIWNDTTFRRDFEWMIFHQFFSDVPKLVKDKLVKLLESRADDEKIYKFISDKMINRNPPIPSEIEPDQDLQDAISIGVLYREFISTSPGKYLDVGCGRGHLSVLVGREIGAANILGIDIFDPRPAEGLQYQKYDGKVIPFPDNSIDFVSAFLVLHHIKPTCYGILAEIHRVLVPGGYFMFREQDTRNKYMNTLVMFEHFMYMMMYTDNWSHFRQRASKYFQHLYNSANLRERLTKIGFEYIGTASQEYMDKYIPNNHSYIYYGIYQKKLISRDE